MNVADYIVQLLAAHGVRHVFGYPGAAIMPLMEAIERHPDLEWVLMRHEGSASLAASASARVTGKLAVCIASSGPGATNLITGLVDAQADRLPVLSITGMVPSWKQWRSGFQDIDQARLIASLVPDSVICGHPDQPPSLLRDLIGKVEHERQAAHVAIPHDVQATEIADDDHRFSVDLQPRLLTLQPPPPKAIEIVVEDLAKAGSVAIAVGARARGAGPALERLAEKLQAPLITALDAKGIVDESHACAFGVLGIFGSAGVELTRAILDQTDVVLAVGLDNVAAFVTDQSGIQVRELFQVEPDFSSITHRLRRARTLVGPLTEIAQALAEQVPRREPSAVFERAAAMRDAQTGELAALPAASSSDGVHPIELLRELSQRLVPDDVIALDVGDNTVWSAKFLTLRERQHVLVSNQLGTMGFALPAAVAAALARPGKRTVAICGDGGFQMAMGELMTAVQEKLPITVLVFANGMLQRVAAQQQKPIGTRLVDPDFAALAEACGARGLRIDASSDVGAVLDQALAVDDRPCVVECRISPDERAPMGDWADDFVPMHFA